jgi:hypothetical protein
MDSAPDWVGAAHPDASFVASNGLPSSPVLARLLLRPSGVRRRCRVLTAAACTVADKPASTAGTW